MPNKTLLGYCSRDEETIIAQCTPKGSGAIALLRICGLHAITFATQMSKLAVLADLGTERFIGAIQAADEKGLSKVSGIGAKKAEQLIVQLKHKVAKLVKSGVEVGATATTIAWHDVEQVLESLNYSRTEIADSMRYLRETATGSEYSFDKLVRQALSFLAKRP